MKNDLNFIFYRKGYINFCGEMPLSPQDGWISSYKEFFAVFSENNVAFFEKFVQ